MNQESLNAMKPYLKINELISEFVFEVSRAIERLDVGYMSKLIAE